MLVYAVLAVIWFWLMTRYAAEGPLEHDSETGATGAAGRHKTSRHCHSRTEECAMELQQVWFIIVAVLFLGFFVLEGFDFGVGMLMAPLGRVAKGDPEQHRRAVLNTIGPVWDGNEVWLITAGGAMFAAFPELVRHSVLHAVPAAAGDPVRDDPARRRDRVARQDRRRRTGGMGRRRHRRWDRGCLRSCGASRSRFSCAGSRSTRSPVHLSIGDVLNPYTLLGGLATAGLFLFHGAVFIGLKTEGAVRDDALRFAKALSLPVTAVVAAFRSVDPTGARQGLDVGGVAHRGRWPN